MSQAHQLGAIRARVCKSLLSLIRCIHSLPRCQRALQILENHKYPRDRERTKRRCRERFTNWDYLLADFFDGLKTMVPPRVRNEMWAIAEVKALDGIVFSLTDSARVWPLYPELRRHVEEKRPLADFRLSTKAGFAFGTDQIRYYLPTLLLNTAITPEWPDVVTAMKRVENYFKTCEEIAKNEPEDFRLTPSSLDVAVAELCVLLGLRETHSRKRVEHAHPEPGIKREIALAAHDHYRKDHSAFGGTFEEMELELRDRWPEMSTESTKATVLESFRRGLIRVFGEDMAHQRGFAPLGGEFNDDAQLDRWLSSAMGDDGERLLLRLKLAMPVSDGVIYAPLSQTLSDSPPQRCGTGADGGTKKKNRRGAPQITVPEADRRIYEDWKASKADGIPTVEEFARQKGIDKRDAILAIDRHEKRLANRVKQK